MRRVLIAFAVMLAVVVPGSPAWAHNQLVRAEPGANSTVATSPNSVMLVFLERLNPEFTTIVVTDAARQRVPSSVPAVDAAEGTVTLDAPLANGAYTVAYRVVSVDGHAVQGSYRFTVADPSLPPASVPPSAPPSATPVAADVADDRGMVTPVLIGLGVAAVVLAAVAAYLYAIARRRTAARPG